MRTRLASVFLAIILSGTALADGWRPGFGLPGFDGPVQALAEYEGDLYVAGKFAVASGTSAPRIARWNGAQWVDLGIEFGYNDEVCALLVHEGSLIVSGKFYFQDNTGAYCRSIARWDGTQWHAMGDGFSNNFVRALGLDPDGNLIAGGSMYYSGSTAVRNIARWTGAAWAPLGSGLYSEVYDIEVYNGARRQRSHLQRLRGPHALWCRSLDSRRMGRILPAAPGFRWHRLRPRGQGRLSVRRR